MPLNPTPSAEARAKAAREICEYFAPISGYETWGKDIESILAKQFSGVATAWEPQGCPCRPVKGQAWRSHEAEKRCGHQADLVAALREHQTPTQGEDAYLRLYPCDARKLVTLLDAAVYLLNGGLHDGADEACEACGAPGSIKETNGWYRCRCDSCLD